MWIQALSLAATVQTKPRINGRTFHTTSSVTKTVTKHIRKLNCSFRMQTRYSTRSNSLKTRTGTLWRSHCNGCKVRIQNYSHNCNGRNPAHKHKRMKITRDQQSFRPPGPSLQHTIHRFATLFTLKETTPQHQPAGIPSKFGKPFTVSELPQWALPLTYPQKHFQNSIT